MVTVLEQKSLLVDTQPYQVTTPLAPTPVAGGGSAGAMKICICGAGPAGLLAAILLAQRGHSIDVLEGRPKWDVNSVEEPFSFEWWLLLLANSNS